jgi:hypothetical protein
MSRYKRHNSMWMGSLDQATSTRLQHSRTSTVGESEVSQMCLAIEP